MYILFQDVIYLLISLSVMLVYKQGDVSILVISVFVVKVLDGNIYILIVNIQLEGVIEVILEQVKQVRGKVLSSDIMDEYNIFE